MNKIKVIYIIVTASTILLSACNEPRTTRTRKSDSSKFSAPSYSSVFNTGNSTNNTDENSRAPVESSSPTDDSITPGETADFQSVPQDASHCSWSQDGITGYPFTHAHIGDYSFCQSASNTTILYFQLKTAIQNAHLCFIPTTNDGSMSTYIGEPRCIIATDPLKIYTIQMYKNRQNYGSFPLTGAMILKDLTYHYGSPFYQYLLAPDAYLFCAEWLAKTGDSSYCSSFNAVGQHVYHQF